MITPSETELLLRGYGLTTAQLFYRMPDYPSVLNTFIWQKYDCAPDYPALFAFIEFWQKEIEDALHSVQFTHRRTVAPSQWRHVTHELYLQPSYAIYPRPHALAVGILFIIEFYSFFVIIWL